MTSVGSYYKEQTGLRRQFTVYPYYASGVNTFFTVQNNTLYRAQADLSGVDYVVARDLGTEMAITGIDPNLLTLWTSQEISFSTDFTNAKILKTGSARKFQVLSMVAGFAGYENPTIAPPGTFPEPTSRLFYTNNYNIDPYSSNGNYATGGEAFMDTQNFNGLFDVTGNGGGLINGSGPSSTAMPINELLIVGSGNTTILTNTTQNLPFGTFWAMNDPIVIGYEFSGYPISRAIKNRIDETTLF